MQNRNLLFPLHTAPKLEDLQTFPTTFYNSSVSAPPNAPKTAVVYYTHQSHVMVGPEF